MQPTDLKPPRQRKKDRPKRDGMIGAARELRSNPTQAEKTLWEALRRKQAGGMRFRRQRVIGPYIVDFCCLDRKLVAEVDGAHHVTAEGAAYDDDRTAFLQAQGYRVMRFPNSAVLDDIERVVASIMTPAPPDPFPPSEIQGKIPAPDLSLLQRDEENELSPPRTGESRRGGFPPHTTRKGK